MSRGIVVVGASGHAKVCIEILRHMGEDVAICVAGPDAAGSCLGVPVVGGDENLGDLRTQGYERAFVAIGDNATRCRMAELLQRTGFRLTSAISPAATVSPSATLGLGVAVMAGVVVNADADIRDLAIVNTGATVDHDCVVGSGAHVAPQCALAGNVTVGRMSFLGVGTKVVPGRRIGECVTTGAGAVVISDLPDGVTAVGVPTRIVSGPVRRG